MSYGLGMPCFKAGDGRVAFKDQSKSDGGRVVFKGEPPFAPAPITIEAIWSPTTIGAIPSCGNYHDVELAAMSVGGVEHVVNRPTVVLNPGAATVRAEVSAETDTDCAYPEEDPDGTITLVATQPGVVRAYTVTGSCGCVTRGGPGHRAVVAVVDIMNGVLSGMALKG